MKILFHTSLIEKKMGGATISTLEVLQGLVQRGHSAIAVAKKAERGEVLNIPVYQEDRHLPVSMLYAWADVVFVMRRPPLQHLREYDRWDTPHGAPPIYTVFFAHNVGQPFKNGYVEDDLDLVVFNTHWVQEVTGWKGDSIVLHPPIFKERYLVDRKGDCLTQINLSRKKGGEFFWQLAGALPQKQFIAVKGRERDQVIPEQIPANVELVEYTPDICSIYERTRVLLMPSQGYGEQHRWTDEFSAESYGRVAVEAAVSGIPVIAYPAQGIKEALGEEGLYCAMAAAEWVEIIQMLGDEGCYERVSDAIRKVGERLDPLGDIERFERLLLKNVEQAIEQKRGRYKAYFDIAPAANRTRLPRRKIGVAPIRERPKLLTELPRVQQKFRKWLKNIFKRGVSAGRFFRRLTAYLAFSLLGKVYPRSRSSVVVLAPEHGSFADNAKYTYLRLRGEDDLQVTYITPDKGIYRKLREEGIAAEVYPSRAAAMELLRAGAVVGVMGKSFEGIRGHLTAGASKIQLWHGEGVKRVQLGQRERKKSKVSLTEKISWCISRRFTVYDLIYFPTEEQYQRRKNWFRYKRYRINGMIRNDLLRGKDFGPGTDVYTDRSTLERVRVLKAGGAKLVLYAPTRRRRGQPAFGDQIPFDFTAVDDMLQRQNSYLVVKLHPRMKEHVDFGLFDRILEYSKLNDIYPALGFFDCLITDYSSIANDFKIFKRPIIRYFPDYDRVVNSGMISEEAYSEMPGLLFFDFGDMLINLEDTLERVTGDKVVDEPSQFSGDRLVEDIRLLLDGYDGK